MRAKDIMSSPVTTISSGSTLLDAARLLINANVSALPVVDEGQSMVGIVSEVDLIRRILGDSTDASCSRFISAIPTATRCWAAASPTS